jgi:hypothetical protein
MGIAIIDWVKHHAILHAEVYFVDPFLWIDG